MNLTIIFIISAAVIAGLFDIWVIAKKGKYESISAHVIRGSKKYPLVVLLFGVLLGHLFWSMDTFDRMPKEELIERCRVLIGEK
jgi:hypothetical protein